jgi:diguanylate cyclase (GGDEF)-like protein
MVYLGESGVAMLLLASAEGSLLALVLGGMLVATGVITGWGLARLFTPRPAGADAQREELTALLGGLHHWTSDVSTDVSEYRSLIEMLTAEMAREAERTDQGLSPPTAHLLAQMMEANRHLQARLDVAESALQAQAADIDSFAREARTDALTSVSNRRVFDETLAAGLAAWHDKGQPVAVMLLDIDHFKSLNDTQGHLAGDAVLCQLGQLLRERAPRGALVARFGGEEFACIVTGTDLPTAASAAEQLRQAVASHTFTFERDALHITISCGVAQATFREEAFSLLKRCDTALYASKSAGRNVVHLHDGYHCLAITKNAIGELLPSAEEQIVKDFRDVCDDLRSRLSQLAATAER